MSHHVQHSMSDKDQSLEGPALVHKLLEEALVADSGAPPKPIRPSNGAPLVKPGECFGAVEVQYCG